MSLAIRFAQVVRVYPKFRTCEIAFADEGWRTQNVPILSDYASSNSGGWSMHNMPRPPSEQDAGGYHPDPNARTVLAVVAMVDDRPFVIGFLPHAMTQMAFVQSEQNRDIWRHPSGTIGTINRNGSFELQHTGGAFIRVAAQVDSPTLPDNHEDLTPRAWNLNWALPENEPPTITISVGNKSGEAFKLRVRPNGDTDIMSSGNLNVRYQGNAHIDVGGDAEIHVAGDTTASIGGDLRARAMGDVTATAAGDAHLLAQGNGSMVSQGDALVGSASKLTLEAPQIDIVTGSLDITAGQVGVAAATIGVTGEVGILGGLAVTGTVGVTGTFGMTGAMGVVGVVDATDFVTAGGFPGAPGFGGGGGGAPGGVAAELALAGQEVAAGTADLAQAAVDIEQAVQEAVLTSAAARGTAPPDNLGGPVPGSSSMGDAGDVVG